MSRHAHTAKPTSTPPTTTARNASSGQAMGKDVGGGVVVVVVMVVVVVVGMVVIVVGMVVRHFTLTDTFFSASVAELVREGGSVCRGLVGVLGVVVSRDACSPPLPVLLSV
ncbi:hypothetical protein E2C01_001996 [Portunus trituberculatus]|uniref:Uncharacterized protein n=1 Tax=Portunus trituberculatus TaxID=210409 RepID=A0A5B7CKY4_PORTR|nr:hypothetical protein [Portunus trituberculatus]